MYHELINIIRLTSRGAPEQKRFSCSASTPWEKRVNHQTTKHIHNPKLGKSFSLHRWYEVERKETDLEEGKLRPECLHIGGGGDVEHMGLLTPNDQLHVDF